MTKIAIIGAGMSGLTLAHRLKDVAEVVLFEKSRGVGGRMATRYAEPFEFDHGAQFFTAKTLAFQQFLQPLLQQGVIARWDARFVEFERHHVAHRRKWEANYPHYVGTPRMNSVAKYLAQDLSVCLNTRITQLIYQNHGWQIIDEKGEHLGTYDWVITATPAEQSAVLLPSLFSHSAALLSKEMMACFSLMLGFKHALNLDWDAALVKDADISWISVNSSKPGRKNVFTLLVNSSNAWAEQHLNLEHEIVQRHLCDITSNTIGHDVTQAHHMALHRWRYANTGHHTPASALMIDREHKLAACGDWLAQGRVEAAFSSGYALAHQLKIFIG
jgi:predicted NAD/FAD-dependent oxidoreductase